MTHQELEQREIDLGHVLPYAEATAGIDCLAVLPRADDVIVVMQLEDGVFYCAIDQDDDTLRPAADQPNALFPKLLTPATAEQVSQWAVMAQEAANRLGDMQEYLEKCEGVTP